MKNINTMEPDLYETLTKSMDLFYKTMIKLHPDEDKKKIIFAIHDETAQDVKNEFEQNKILYGKHYYKIIDQAYEAYEKNIMEITSKMLKKYCR